MSILSATSFLRAKYKQALLAILLVVGTLVLSGCSLDVPTETSSQASQSSKQEDVQKDLVKAVPTPTVKNSQTRQALVERTNLFDDQNKITYIYLISYGKIFAFYPIKGQAVSLRSYLTPMENIVDGSGKLCATSGDCYTQNGGHDGYVVSAPDVDGTYGDNSDGIFFFTADTNAYVEWKGDYLVSDQPLKLSQPTELVREVNR